MNRINSRPFSSGRCRSGGGGGAGLVFRRCWILRVNRSRRIIVVGVNWLGYYVRRSGGRGGLNIFNFISIQHFVRACRAARAVLNNLRAVSGNQIGFVRGPFGGRFELSKGRPGFRAGGLGRHFVARGWSSSRCSIAVGAAAAAGRLAEEGHLVFDIGDVSVLVGPEVDNLRPAVGQ